jgi:hypothetical protein
VIHQYKPPVTHLPTLPPLPTHPKPCSPPHPSQRDELQEDDLLIYQYKPEFTGRHRSAGGEEQDFEQVRVCAGRCLCAGTGEGSTSGQRCRALRALKAPQGALRAPRRRHASVKPALPPPSCPPPSRARQTYIFSGEWSGRRSSSGRRKGGGCGQGPAREGRR